VSQVDFTDHFVTRYFAIFVLTFSFLQLASFRSEGSFHSFIGLTHFIIVLFTNQEFHKLAWECWSRSHLTQLFFRFCLASSLFRTWVWAFLLIITWEIALHSGCSQFGLRGPDTIGKTHLFFILIFIANLIKMRFALQTCFKAQVWFTLSLRAHFITKTLCHFWSSLHSSILYLPIEFCLCNFWFQHLPYRIL